MRVLQVRDGATAQILLVEDAPGGKLKGTFAWCGDSSAVLADMRDGSIVYATPSHTAGPDHQGGGSWREEKARLEFYDAVRRQLEGTHGIDTQKDAADSGMVQVVLSSTSRAIPSAMSNAQ